MKIVLASTSPRRKELLSKAGLRFALASPEVDETRRRGETPAAMVRRLARAKAAVVARGMLARDAVVIAADTIVVAPGGRVVLGKPRNAAEAARMLRRISGRAHSVLTAYCLMSVGPGKKRGITRTVRTRVWIARLGVRRIRAYVATGEPMDKAGAYAAQGIGATFIEKVSGSYTNVIGLPVVEVMADLRKYFGVGAT